MRKKIKQTKDLKNIIILRSPLTADGEESSKRTFSFISFRGGMTVIWTAMVFLLSVSVWADSTQPPKIRLGGGNITETPIKPTASPTVNSSANHTNTTGRINIPLDLDAVFSPGSNNSSTKSAVTANSPVDNTNIVSPANQTKMQAHNSNTSEVSLFPFGESKLFNGIQGAASHAQTNVLSAVPSNSSVAQETGPIDPQGINMASVDDKLSKGKNSDYKGAYSYKNPMGAYYNNGRRVNDPSIINPKYKVVNDDGTPYNNNTLSQQSSTTVYIPNSTQSRTPVGMGPNGMANYQQFDRTHMTNSPVYNEQGAQVTYDAAYRTKIAENINNTKSVTLFNGEHFEVSSSVTGQSDVRANGFYTKQGWFIPFSQVDKGYTDIEGVKGETKFLYNRYQ